MMQTIINKRPNAKYLETKTISISAREYDIMANDNIKSELKIHNQLNELVYTIKKSKYKKLICSSRTSDTGEVYYVVDFSGAL